MNRNWEKTEPKKRKPPRPTLKDKLAEEAQEIAEQHARMKREFYERTAPKWLKTGGN